MLTLLKLIQSIIKTLHSEGTPGQVAAGIAIGSVLGLTPIFNLHNLIIFSLVVVLNVSFGGAMLGWAVGLAVFSVCGCIALFVQYVRHNLSGAPAPDPSR